MPTDLGPLRCPECDADDWSELSMIETWQSVVVGRKDGVANDAPLTAETTEIIDWKGEWSTIDESNGQTIEITCRACGKTIVFGEYKFEPVGERLVNLWDVMRAACLAHELNSDRPLANRTLTPCVDLVVADGRRLRELPNAESLYCSLCTRIWRSVNEAVPA